MKVQGQEIEFFMFLCFHVSPTSRFHLHTLSVHNFIFFDSTYMVYLTSSSWLWAGEMCGLITCLKIHVLDWESEAIVDFEDGITRLTLEAA